MDGKRLILATLAGCGFQAHSGLWVLQVTLGALKQRRGVVTSRANGAVVFLRWCHGVEKRACNRRVRRKESLHVD